MCTVRDGEGIVSNGAGLSIHLSISRSVSSVSIPTTVVVVTGDVQSPSALGCVVFVTYDAEYRPTIGLQQRNKIRSAIPPKKPSKNPRVPFMFDQNTVGDRNPWQG